MMKYYVTIYIDELFEEELLSFDDLTHTFLGLTHIHPDELDKLDEEKRKEKLKNTNWKNFDKRWYESLDTNEFNDGFWGFGFAGNWYDIGVFTRVIGKVFSNNHYLVDNNTQTNTYNIKRLRSSQTFKPSNRCILEISQEQYETLLQNIKKDFEATREIKPQSLKAINDEFSYNLYTKNCVLWVIKKLLDIGIEVINEDDYTAPGGNFMECFSYFKFLHSIFLNFQNIDENLETIKGAKAFRTWARMMIDNNYICYVNEQAIENKIKAYCKKDIENQRYYENIKKFYTKEAQLTSIYKRLNEMLNKMIYKLNNEKLKGNLNLSIGIKLNKNLKF